MLCMQFESPACHIPLTTVMKQTTTYSWYRNAIEVQNAYTEILSFLGSESVAITGLYQGTTASASSQNFVQTAPFTIT